MYLSFFSYQLSFYQKDNINWPRFLTIVAIQLIFTSIPAYINYFFFLPRFLEQKKAGKYLLGFLLPFALLYLIRMYTERYLLDGFTHKYEYLYGPRFIIQTIVVTLFITVFVAMLRFAIEWFELDSKKKSIENEKLSAELRFLKAQINPHFLFNTLNNLYYLAFTQSPNTTEVIAKLSQMMRYMIYDSNHPRVMLSKEIEYMENYISLEKLRLNNQIPIHFEVHGTTGHVLIVPLILITFLENAFKHGVSNNNPEAWINVKLELQGTECVYIVENSKLPDKTLKPEKSGIGLQNVQRRLDLSYPENYSLKITDTSDRYRIELKLNAA
ncbi:sensor histidine kinase [Xanthocytophaga flava]|nr:histidine kinase [Xanthocytophaga flavus]